MESRVEGLISQLHEITDKSVAVGFGVSGPEQVFSSLPLLCCTSSAGTCRYCTQWCEKYQGKLVVKLLLFVCRLGRSWLGVQRESLWAVPL